MKKITQYITTTIMLCCGAAIAAPMDHIKTQTVSQGLSHYLKQANDGWFAYTIKAAPETASMCCFNGDKQNSCDLNRQQHGYGSSSESPDTDNIHIFVQLQQGVVARIMPVGDYCKVKAEGITVDWLSNVTEQQSIQWLKQEAKVQQDQNGSLYVLSLHQHSQAAKAMYQLAKDNHRTYSEPAIFWLGQRKHDGFAYLQDLYHDLPQGDVRRHLNFALSQHPSAEATALLKKIAEYDQDTAQQADAIFWLSQLENIDDLPVFFNKLINDSPSLEVQEKAIFSLSQIQSEEANQQLVQLVKNHKQSAVREQALFWLVHNNPEQAQQTAIELLKTAKSEGEQENAVFVLSQLPNQQSADALFAIIKGKYPKNIKKKAIFWLSQSDDEKTLARLEKLL